MSTTSTLKVSKREVKSIVQATFPEYKGLRFWVEFTDKVSFYDTNCSGGTKNEYAAVASDGRVARLNVPAPWVNPVEGSTVELPADVLIVKHSYFCGHDTGITIYANSVHMPKWLPSGK